MPEGAKQAANTVLQGRMILQGNKKQSGHKEKRKPEYRVRDESYESFLHDKNYFF
jgi:hypothetical protein